MDRTHRELHDAALFIAKKFAERLGVQRGELNLINSKNKLSFFFRIFCITETMGNCFDAPPVTPDLKIGPKADEDEGV